MFKAVAYWYDPSHDDTYILPKVVNDIDLELREVGTNNSLRVSNSYYDNKERVFYSDIGGKAVYLRLIGDSVPADYTSCGTNSMKVYVTYFFEDSDRDDTDGPAWNSTTLLGVEPEDY